MNILFTVTDLSGEAGGVAAATAALAENLAARGHHVTIGTVDHGGTHLNPHEVRVARFPLDGSARLAKSSQLNEFLRHQVPAHDVVQIQGLWQSPGHQAAAICRKFKIPYVVAPHGMLDEKSLRMGNRYMKRLFWWLADGPMYRGAAAVQCLNTAEERVSPWLAGLPVVHIANGIDDHIFAEMPPQGAFRSRYFANQPAARIVLFLSRIHPKKGLDRFLPLWPQLIGAVPNARLVIAGTGEPAHLRAIQDQIGRLGIGASVQMVGQLNGRDKWQALRDADVFILPSRQEGFSMAITEAMAAGCPVVITRACQFDEVETGGAGIIAPDDSMAGFSDAVVSIFNNPDKRVGAAGRRLVGREYLWSKIIDEMENLYHRVAPAAATEE
jgi:glycosyltransferase involved in cell wall biosynthesis